MKLFLFFSIFSFFLLLGTVAVRGQEKNPMAIDSTYSSKNQDSRIHYLIYHHTGGGMHSSLVTLMGETSREVSSHYLINDNPTSLYPSYIYQLVQDEERSWHAGISGWRIDRSLNFSSIGVETVNHDGNHFSYPQKQQEHILELGKHLIKKYEIKPAHVLGHSDIAPLRKDDPGILFPWKYLYDNGVGAWPDKTTVNDFKKSLPVPSVAIYQQDLHKYGYVIEPTGKLSTETIATIRAFQRHFRQKKADGIMDKETYGILKALIHKYQ